MEKCIGKKIRWENKHKETIGGKNFQNYIHVNIEKWLEKP